jgi:transposase
MQKEDIIMKHTTSTHTLSPMHDMMQTVIKKVTSPTTTVSQKGHSWKMSRSAHSASSTPPHQGMTVTTGTPHDATSSPPRQNQKTSAITKAPDALTAPPLESPSPYALFIAIDWADKGHDVCVLNPNTQQRTHRELEQSPSALQAWLQDIQRQHPDQRIAVALEQKTGALINFLLEFDWIDVYPVNPVTLARYRKAFHVSGAKDDPTDANLILDLLTLHRNKLRRLTPDDALTRALQRLTRKRRDAVKHRTRFNNQLKDLLKQYYPLFLKVCGEDLFAPLACHLLLRYPTFDDLTQADPQEVRQFYREHGSWKLDVIAQRLAVIREAQPLTTDAAIIQPAILEARMLATLLLDVGKSIKAYDTAIAELFPQHPDAPIFDSFPGAGPVIAPRLLSAFGTNRGRFETSTEVENTMGISPVKQESGTMNLVHWRSVCSKFLRQSFHEYANESIYHSIWARAYYQQQRDKGKKHHAAIRALAFKWIRIMFRCWNTRQPYNELMYLKALQRRHAPLLAYISKSDQVFGQ